MSECVCVCVCVCVCERKREEALELMSYAHETYFGKRGVGGRTYFTGSRGLNTYRIYTHSMYIRTKTDTDTDMYS